MRVARTAAIVGFGVIAVAIVVGVFTGGVSEQGRTILGLPWGRVALVDTYVALLTVWAWIAWRERDVLRAVVWLLVVVVLGSLAVTAYVLTAALRADDVVDLLVGDRRQPVPDLWRPKKRGRLPGS